jgi:hypothetical protein
MNKPTSVALPFFNLVLPVRHADEVFRAELLDAPKGAAGLWQKYLDAEVMARDLLLAGQRGNAYFSPMTFSRNANRRTEENARRSQCLWADLDVCCEGERTHKPDHYKTLDDALAAAEGFALKPHVVLLTGRGALGIWRLAEPVEGDDLARLIRLVRGLAATINGDPNVALATQLIRCPGTKNFDPKRKKDGKTYTVRLHRIDPELARYTLDDFAKAGVPEVEAKSKQHAAQMDLPLGDGKVVDDPPISARMKRLLNTPGQEDYPSPSEADAAVITAMLGAGLSPADAAATFRVSARGQDAAERKSDLDNYIERTLRSAEAKVDEDRQQAHEHIEAVAGASANGNGPSGQAPPAELQFPEAAWHGLFADYRHAMGESEAPDAHHFGAALTLVGAALGRRVFVRYRKPAYPNLYGVLVGKTGMSRKTTSMRTALDDLLLAVEPEFRYISAPGSAEGLMEQVATAGMTAAEREQYNAHIDDKPLEKDGPVPEMPLAPVEGRRLLFAPEEFALLLTKARQDGSSNLGPVITAIYDCPNRYDPPTRKRPIIALKPTVSILTATAPAWVEKYLGASELLSGFVNRFCFFGGSPRAPIPWPKEPDQPFLNTVREQLHRALVEWEGKEHEFDLDEPASRLWALYYAAHYSRLATYPDSHAAVVQRCPLFAVKISLIFAALRCDSPTINAEDLERATLVADFLEHSALELLGDLGGDKDLELEAKILKRLAGGVHLKKRQLHQSVSGRFAAERFNRAIEALVRAEIIRSDQQGALYDPAAKVETA